MALLPLHLWQLLVWWLRVRATLSVVDSSLETGQHLSRQHLVWHKLILHLHIIVYETIVIVVTRQLRCIVVSRDHASLLLQHTILISHIQTILVHYGLVSNVAIATAPLLVWINKLVIDVVCIVVHVHVSGIVVHLLVIALVEAHRVL